VVQKVSSCQISSRRRGRKKKKILRID